MNTPAKTSVSSEIFMTLRREILSGKFARNEKFPSEQMLVRRFKVARTTVRLALNRLKEDGILETRNGSGTYLSAMANRATGRLGLIIPHITHGEISPQNATRFKNGPIHPLFNCHSRNGSSARAKPGRRQYADTRTTASAQSATIGTRFARADASPI